jgi:hypothetical protein
MLMLVEKVVGDPRSTRAGAQWPDHIELLLQLAAERASDIGGCRAG